MRIVYLANSTWPVLRGAERLMLSLLERGRSRGHEVCVFAPPASAIHEACRQRKVRSEPVEFQPSLAAIAHTRGLFRDLRPDIVHGMSIFPVAFVRRLRLCPGSGRVGWFAYVSTDPDPARPVAATRARRIRYSIRNAIARREAPQLEAIFTPSASVAQRLEALGICGRVIVVSGAIDPDRLAADAELPFDAPAGSPRIGYASYLGPFKGIEDLVTAFAETVRDHPEAVLLLAGEGPQQEALSHLANDLGVSERVFFMGQLSPIAPFLAALDVFVSPSHSEALGRSILEAMALGVPCVCSASGGPAEFLNDGENGLLVPPGEPTELASTLRRLLEDRGLASRIAERGRATALSEGHLLSTTLDTIFAEYERATARSTGTA